MALQRYAGLFVLDKAGRQFEAGCANKRLTMRSDISNTQPQRPCTYDRRVVRNLLDNEDSLSASVDIRPDTVELLSEDGVERLYVSLMTPRPSVWLTFFSEPIFSFRVWD